jgi:hypothetical protein
VDDDAHRQPFAVDQGVDFAALHLEAAVLTGLPLKAVNNATGELAHQSRARLTLSWLPNGCQVPKGTRRDHHKYL